jgi:hypothetical protein
MRWIPQKLPECRPSRKLHGLPAYVILVKIVVELLKQARDAFAALQRERIPWTKPLLMLLSAFAANGELSRIDRKSSARTG